MNFKDYILSLSEKFTLTKVDENTYMLHKNKKTLEITPSNMYSIDEIDNLLHNVYPDNNSPFGNIGEDDLHPAIGRKEGKKRGSIFSPKDLREQDEDDMERSDIFPLKKKTDPDNDHFKKQGGDDDNPFLY